MGGGCSRYSTSVVAEAAVSSPSNNNKEAVTLDLPHRGVLSFLGASTAELEREFAGKSREEIASQLNAAAPKLVAASEVLVGVGGLRRHARFIRGAVRKALARTKRRLLSGDNNNNALLEKTSSSSSSSSSCRNSCEGACWCGVDARRVMCGSTRGRRRFRVDNETSSSSFDHRSNDVMMLDEENEEHSDSEDETRQDDFVRRRRRPHRNIGMNVGLMADVDEEGVLLGEEDEDDGLTTPTKCSSEAMAAAADAAAALAFSSSRKAVTATLLGSPFDIDGSPLKRLRLQGGTPKAKHFGSLEEEQEQSRMIRHRRLTDLVAERREKQQQQQQQVAMPSTNIASPTMRKDLHSRWSVQPSPPPPTTTTTMYHSVASSVFVTPPPPPPRNLRPLEMGPRGRRDLAAATHYSVTTNCGMDMSEDCYVGGGSRVANEAISVSSSFSSVASAAETVVMDTAMTNSSYFDSLVPRTPRSHRNSKRPLFFGSESDNGESSSPCTTTITNNNHNSAFNSSPPFSSSAVPMVIPPLGKSLPTLLAGTSNSCKRGAVGLSKLPLLSSNGGGGGGNSSDVVMGPPPPRRLVTVLPH